MGQLDERLWQEWASTKESKAHENGREAGEGNKKYGFTRDDFNSAPAAEYNAVQSRFMPHCTASSAACCVPRSAHEMADLVSVRSDGVKRHLRGEAHRRGNQKTSRQKADINSHQHIADKRTCSAGSCLVVHYSSTVSLSVQLHRSVVTG